MKMKDIIDKIVYDTYDNSFAFDTNLFNGISLASNKHNRIIVEMRGIAYDESIEQFLTKRYSDSIKQYSEELSLCAKFLYLLYNNNPKALMLIKKDKKDYLVKANRALHSILLDIFDLHNNGIRCIGTKVFRENDTLFSDTDLFKTVCVNIGVIIKLIENPKDIDWLFKDRNSLFENI